MSLEQKPRFSVGSGATLQPPRDFTPESDRQIYDDHRLYDSHVLYGVYREAEIPMFKGQDPNLDNKPRFATTKRVGEKSSTRSKQYDSHTLFDKHELYLTEYLPERPLFGVYTQ